MIKYKKGNLVDAWLAGEVDVLIHQWSRNGRNFKTF